MSLQHSKPFLLSSHGSTRATAYGFSNKSLSLGDQVHVVWLDAVAGVRGRSFKRGSGEWGETQVLFEGCDNHTNPTLTADQNGNLRMAYGPHGYWAEWNQGRFKWMISERPGCLEHWRDEASFGYGATYASMVHTPGGFDAIVYRGGESPASLMFQRQRERGGWTSARELLTQEIEPQYTNYGGLLTCDAGGTLYAGCHFYNTGGGNNAPVTGDRSRMGSSGVAVIRSADGGETWTDLHGDPVAIPSVYEERIAVPPYKGNVYLKGLTIDSKGTVWALTLKPALDDERILLSHWVDGNWETVDLQPCLPPDRVAVDAVLTIDTRDRIHLALTATLRGGPDEKAWGAPSSEVFHLVTRGQVEGTQCHRISTPDDHTASWLPNISLSGPFHPVGNPVILYTHGVAGDGCSPTVETEVYAVLVEQD